MSLTDPLPTDPPPPLAIPTPPLYDSMGLLSAHRADLEADRVRLQRTHDELVAQLETVDTALVDNEVALADVQVSIGGAATAQEAVLNPGPPVELPPPTEG